MRVVQRVNTLLHIRRPLTRPRVGAVVLAGGFGARMGMETTKQLLLLREKPLFIHTLLAFDACRQVDEVVLVARKEEIDTVCVLLDRYGIKKCTTVVEGGETRQQSAANGFSAVCPKMEYVAFHDAARCLVTPQEIRDVIAAARAYGAATAAVRATDTVKVANKYGYIEKTVPREDVWLASTPQVMKKEYYAAALQYAQKRGAQVTDDNSLMELIGQRVKLVETSRDNMKITHQEDLERAEVILARREGRNGK